MDLSNQSYANSNMSARLRLAGVRFTTRADMVSMISEFSNSCGQGYLMTSANSGFASSAFQVSSRGCAVGNLTYPHEHGHNMGFAHNPESGGSAVAPYAYGHWHNGQYRTIMSYADPCTNGCTRRPHFSNPDINFNGLPTGVANSATMPAPVIRPHRSLPISGMVWS